jgi:alpha-D-xyloside xylohydrolase
MDGFKQKGDTLVWERYHEQLCLQPWGHNSIRVRATKGGALLELPGALIQPEPVGEAEIDVTPAGASLANGDLEARVTPEGRVSFFKGGQALFEEPSSPIFDPVIPARTYKSMGGNLFRIEARFKAYEDERFYGLGQRQHGLLDQKGCVLELSQRNTEVSIPFTISSRGYGFLWNNPAVGRVELGVNGTRWVAEASHQLDYWVTAGNSPAEILENYAIATGHPPMLPEWASGFWQSKLRYSSQEEVLEIAVEYQRRGLPLSVIVIDGGHWTLMGEWKFDPQYWPDPAGMVHQLEKMGVKAMVSIWPTVNGLSPNYAYMAKNGLLLRTERGVPAQTVLLDNQPKGPVYLSHYDPTNPEARQFVWEQVRQNYLENGIGLFWLDANEPEMYPLDHDNLRYHIGNGAEVTNLFPLMHQRTFFDGLQAEGQTEILTLSRSAWAGSQRYGGALWSGDVNSTFEALSVQVRAGLNAALSGIPWWTTDIGGFHGGDPRTTYFQELIVRWFQYGAFCPLFRLHGFRQPSPSQWIGAPNEVWSFGEQAYSIISEYLFLRERLRPYIMEQMRLAQTHLRPVMRPLFFDFPGDSGCVEIDDQFMFGLTCWWRRC